MAKAERIVLLVGHEDRVSTRISVRARLLGLTPRTCLTGERAIELAESTRPFAVISELILPGGDGLRTLAEIERAWPGINTVLLSVVPPGPSPQDKLRHNVDTILVRRGAWEAALVQAAFPGCEVPQEAQALSDALQDQGPQSLVALVQTGALPAHLEALALEYLSATQPPEVLLPILERAVQTEPRPQVWRRLLALACDQKRAGLDIVAAIVAHEESPYEVRGAAIRWLAKTFDLQVILPVISALVAAPGPLGLDAATALYEAARDAGDPGFEVLVELAEGGQIPAGVRAAALRTLAQDFEPHRVHPVFARLSQDRAPGMQDLASRLLAQTDDFQVQGLLDQAEAPNASPQARIAALRQAAAQLPAQTARPLLERAQLNPDPAVQTIAFELALSRSPTGYEDSLQRAIAAGAASAALLGVMKLGRRGLQPLRALATEAALPAHIRAKALRLMALRFAAQDVLPIVKQALLDPSLQPAARLAAVQMGRPGLGLLYSTLSSKLDPEGRVAVLETLEAHAPDRLVQDALRRASRDPAPQVRMAAVRFSARRAGAEIDGLLKALHAAQQPDLYAAAVQGADSLHICGFVGLAKICLDAAVPLQARRQAWGLLCAGHEPEVVASVQDALRQRAPEVLAPPAPAPAPAPSAPNPTAGSTSSGKRAVAWDASGPARAAVPRPVAAGPAVAAWEVADTAPARPAELPEASEAVTRPAPPARPAAPPAEATRPDPPAASTGPMPAAATRPDRGQAKGSWAAAIPRGTSSIGRGPAPSAAPAAPPAPAAKPPPPAAKPPAAKPPKPRPTRAAPRPAPMAGDETILPSGPVAPKKPRPKSRQVSLPRARQALQSALALGQDGYRGIKTLADSSRVPTEVRVLALRQLAADFSQRGITDILERALHSDEPAIQNVALSCVMIQRDVALEAVSQLALRSDAEVATRVRTVRFMASRYPKAQTRATLEQMLQAESPQLKKVALESLFTSMRFVQPSQVEGGLINLLKEHEDVQVQISAAKALAAFGGHEGLAALRTEAGIFADGDLKQAARAAIERLQDRLSSQAK